MVRRSRSRSRITRKTLPACDNCGARIVFVKMSYTGGRVPCDPRPVFDGNVCARQIGPALHGFVISKDHPAAGTPYLRYAAHFGTCPDRPVPKPRPDPPPALFDL